MPPVGAVLGRLAGLGDSGEPLVDFPENPSDQPLPARSVVAIEPGAIGQDVVLLFERGSLQKPIVMGLLRPPTPTTAPAPAPADVEIDGERIVLAAEKEIVLRCGEASLTLTRAGKVLIRGAYLLSRSSGVNRIKGGSVQIN